MKAILIINILVATGVFCAMEINAAGYDDNTAQVDDALGDDYGDGFDAAPIPPQQDPPIADAGELLQNYPGEEIEEGEEDDDQPSTPVNEPAAQNGEENDSFRTPPTMRPQSSPGGHLIPPSAPNVETLKHYTKLGFSNFREYRQHLARQAKEERYFRMNGMTIRDSESLNAMEIEEICSVCLDEIGDGKKRKVAQVYCGTHSQPDENGNTLYGHFFHEECFRQLSERNPVGLQCPNCRKLVDRRPLQQNPDNDDDDDDHFGGDDATVVPQSLENRFDS